MTFVVRELKSVNKEEWNACLYNNNGHFLQSYEWGEFNIDRGHDCWYIGIYNERNELAAVVLALHRVSLSFLHWVYVPFLTQYSAEVQGVILDFLNKKAHSIGAIGVRIEPYELDSDNKICAQLEQRGYQSCSDHIQPPETIILDLSVSTDELLEQMHKKTRYNIRLAQKKNVQVRVISDASSVIDDFIELIKRTSQRQGFYVHESSYYEALVRYMNIYMVGVWYNNELIAMNMMLDYDKTTVYLHGASDYNYRRLMAPYLAQWTAITDAQSRGQLYYDLWGISTKETHNQWSGFTRFKLGFSQSVAPTEYSGMYQCIVRRSYYILFRLLKYIQQVKVRLKI